VTLASGALSTAESVPETNSGKFADYDDSLTITASQGTLTDNGDGTWSWTQTGNESDSGTVTVTAKNADGNSVSTPFTVAFTDVEIGRASCSERAESTAED